MNHCSDALTAEQLAALRACLPALAGLAQAILAFRSQPMTPHAAQKLEEDLQRLTREVGRAALQDTLNCLEPDDPDALPDEITLGGTRHRRRRKTPRLVSSTFGTLTLRRWLYEPRESGERCLFPLELLLGLVAQAATPALADRVGRLVAVHPQRAVLQLLRSDNGLVWSHALLRKVAAKVAQAISGNRRDAQVAPLLAWLKQAYRSRGRYEPVLAVGRDGVMVSISGQKQYQEASVATVAVYDRQGKRLGTLYLGCMPQALQKKLSEQLTALIKGMLAAWKGQLPRLVYLSDGGQTPESYYQEVLHKMRDPGRNGERLVWQRVLDYYHAAGYVNKLAEVLFGQTWRAQQWSRRMRHVLKQHGGLSRVLQSASYHRNQQGIRGEQMKEFWAGYNYLHKRRRFMDYASYKSRGIPIGSGVTEAGCKVVVSQRLKLSGMKWQKQGGQAVLDLRVVWLSGVWGLAWLTHIQEPVNKALDTYDACLQHTLAVAA